VVWQDLVHSSIVATNALIERPGARAAHAALTAAATA